jgi:outer membrane protein OmpA-like peptidoglycan-associated protein
MRQTLLSFLILFFLASLNSFAQTNENRTWLSLNIGNHQYDGDYTNEIASFDVLKDISAGFGVHRYLNNSFTLDYLFNFGLLDSDYGSNRFEKYFFNNNLILDFNFSNGIILSKSSFIQPFIGTGAGLTYFAGGDQNIDDNFSFSVPIVAGFDIPISEGASLELKGTYNRTFNDYVDGVTGIDSQNHDDFFVGSLGLKFRLSGPKDSDGDGVSDKNDACIDLPGSLSTNGCPDNDGDGLINSEDLCPDIPGSAQNRGCADTDGDSIVDFEDACPNVAGTREFSGCSDKDGDKIPDGEDVCPEVKGSSATGGCPDDDGDGIKNSVDLCPAFAGTAQFGGCPDSDNDGIIDKEDDCPTLKGIKPNKGCPEVAADVKARLNVIFENLLFASNSANIDPTSLDDLDQLVEIMNDDKDLRLSIEGHTDNRGDNQYNLQLSSLRATAVKEYLVRGGISSERISAVGYGETRPLTSNETAQGRIKNRRVELNISYK